MVNVVLISGSLRADSANRAALRAVAAHLAEVDPVDGQPAITVTESAIGELPLYSEDVETTGWPDQVQHLQHAVATADALIIATPEYNGSMPGGLKNALDWLSRPYGAGALAGKPVATVSASPSPYGARWAHDHLRHVLDVSGAELINADAVVLPQVFDARDETGDIADADVLAMLGRLASEVLVAAGLQSSPEHLDGATIAAS